MVRCRHCGLELMRYYEESGWVHYTYHQFCENATGGKGLFNNEIAEPFYIEDYLKAIEL